jgi:hypothetical protein
MALELTQPLAEMSIKNRPKGEGMSASKAENFTAICDPFV